MNHCWQLVLHRQECSDKSSIKNIYFLLPLSWKYHLCECFSWNYSDPIDMTLIPLLVSSSSSSSSFRAPLSDCQPSSAWETARNVLIGIRLHVFLSPLCSEWFFFDRNVTESSVSMTTDVSPPLGTAGSVSSHLLSLVCLLTSQIKKIHYLIKQ